MVWGQLDLARLIILGWALAEVGANAVSFLFSLIWALPLLKSWSAVPLSYMPTIVLALST